MSGDSDRERPLVGDGGAGGAAAFTAAAAQTIDWRVCPRCSSDASLVYHPAGKRCPGERP